MQTKKKHKYIGILKFFTLHSMVVFLVIGILLYILIYSFDQILLTNTEDQIRENSQLFQTAADQLTAHMVTFYSNLRFNDPFQKVMKARDYSELTYQDTQEFIAAATYHTGAAGKVQVTIKTPLAFFSNVFLDDETDEIDKRMESSRNPGWFGIYTPASKGGHGPQIVFGGRYYADRTYLGQVYISMSPRDLLSALPIPHQTGQYFAIKDQFGEIVFLEEYDLPEHTVEALEKMVQASAEENEHSHSGMFSVQAFPLSGIDCTLYSIADKSAITQPIQWMYLFTLGILGICAIILVGIIVLFRRMIIVPLSQFEKYISELRGKPDLLSSTDNFEVDNACLEIQHIVSDHAALIQSIRSLTGEIQQKAEDLHRSEMLSKNIQIEQLRSQINPHFLYNTLELIRADAIEGNIEVVSSITAAMGKIYRYSIKGEPFVPLRKELEVVRAYLTIQQNRFQSKIRVLNKIDEKALSVMIPKMILQPLVENAVVHGLEPSEGSGMIFIGAIVQDGLLKVTVRDNGIGISPDQLERLQHRLSSQDSFNDHIGICNVNARLKLQYGNRCSLQISSPPGDGTCIVVQIPVG